LLDVFFYVTKRKYKLGFIITLIKITSQKVNNTTEINMSQGSYYG